MGFKAFKTIILMLLLLLAFPIKVKADCASDLYELYGVEYTQVYPDGVIETIQKYNDAKKYLTSFQYVALSDFDSSILNKRLSSLTKRKEHLKHELSNGYYLSWDEIYLLESEYNDVCNKIYNTEKIVSDNSIQTPIPPMTDVPTYTQYQDAISIKKNIDNNSDIGTLHNIKPPILDAFILDTNSDTSCTYRTVRNARVVSLFNGVIKEVGTDYIIIDNGNSIISYYRNLKSVNVDLGDTVKQGDVLGTSNSYVTLQLSLNNNFVDVTELFVEE